jgi:replicative DNA helicase
MNKTDMPKNLAAEQAVLGAVLFSSSVLNDLAEMLVPNDFYSATHALVWRRMIVTYQAGKPVDAVILAQWASAHADLRELGGAQFIADLLDKAAIGLEAVEYAKHLKDLAMRRALIEGAEHMMARASRPVDDVGEVCQEAHKIIDEVQAANADDNALERLDEAVSAEIGALEGRQARGQIGGLRTGLKRLDDRLGGMHPGDLIVLAGRPGMGKTSLATNILHGAAKTGAKCLFLSQEMTREQLAYRWASAEVRRTSGERIEYQRFRSGKFGQSELAEIKHAIKSLPRDVVIDTRSSMTLAMVLQSARAAAKKMGGLDLVFIDYLQIMKIAADRNANFTQAVGEVTGGLKAMAKRMGLPVIVLSQLSRQVEGRVNKRPIPSDLRDSGSIEQDADIILFVYRPAHYIEQEKPEQTVGPKYDSWVADLDAAENLLEVVCAKVRMGTPGTVKLHQELGFDVVVDDRRELPEPGLMGAVA